MNTNWIILLAGLASGALPAWWVTSEHYQKVLAEEHEAQQTLVIEQQEQNRLALLAYANRIVKSEVQNDKNARIVASLRREREQLRVSFPPSCPMPGTTEADTDSDETGGVLPNPVDALFERFQSRAGITIEEADTLNIDAIRHNQIIQ